MSQEEFAKQLGNQIENYKDAKRWRKLMKLVGNPANSSDTKVSLFWDDAAMTAFIIVGRAEFEKVTPYYSDRGSFEQVIDSIPELED